jgi:hypothetical protein
MNASFASGLSAYQGAAVRLNRAADKLTSVMTNETRQSDTPANTPQSATNTPGASAASAPTPIPGSRRAPSSIPEAMVDIIKATHAAKFASTSIRAADDMIGEVLDLTA